MKRAAWVFSVAALLATFAGTTLAHSGPPFPIVSDKLAGPYRVSVWSDPDTTDDGSAAGQFWVTMELADGSPLPRDTYAVVGIRPLDRSTRTPSSALVDEGRTSPVRGNYGNQFVALRMDHEGPFAVHATITGPRGSGEVDATVEATYDLRPARWLLALYVMPFLAVGFLWVKLLVHRRRAAPTMRRS